MEKVRPKVKKRMTEEMGQEEQNIEQQKMTSGEERNKKAIISGTIENIIKIRRSDYLQHMWELKAKYGKKGLARQQMSNVSIRSGYYYRTCLGM